MLTTTLFLIEASAMAILSSMMIMSSSAQMIDLPSGVVERLEENRRHGLFDPEACKKISVVLTDEDTKANFFSSGRPALFTRQAGKIPISDPDDTTRKIGSYDVVITFTSNFDPVRRSIGCVANGAYTFGTGEQITFTAGCDGLPFFTITGGQGSYHGATGYIHFMIPVKGGNRHDIYICNAKEKEDTEGLEKQI